VGRKKQPNKQVAHEVKNISADVKKVTSKVLKGTQKTHSDGDESETEERSDQDDDDFVEEGKRRAEPPPPPSGRTLRTKRKTSDFDPDKGMIDRNFGLNPDYKKQRDAFDEQQLERSKRVKIEEDSGTVTFRYADGDKDSKDLRIIGPKHLADNWDLLTGNLKAESFAVLARVNGHSYLFKTSYNKDVGLAPLDSDGEGNYKAGTNRPFEAIAGDLDERINGNPELRAAVGDAIKAVRDGEPAVLPPELGLSGTQIYGLGQVISEIGLIFSLDVNRAGKDQAGAAKAHQDELLGGKGTFRQLLMKDYLGIKAAYLRNPDNYHHTTTTTTTSS
jgi:hypothetical protein